MAASVCFTMYFDVLMQERRNSIAIALELCRSCTNSQIAKFMGPTWGPPGSCRPQMGPMNLALREPSIYWGSVPSRLSFLYHCVVVCCVCVCFNFLLVLLVKPVSKWSIKYLNLNLNLSSAVPRVDSVVASNIGPVSAESVAPDPTAQLKLALSLMTRYPHKYGWSKSHEIESSEISKYISCCKSVIHPRFEASWWIYASVKTGHLYSSGPLPEPTMTLC